MLPDSKKIALMEPQNNASAYTLGSFDKYIYGIHTPGHF